MPISIAADTKQSHGSGQTILGMNTIELRFVVLAMLVRVILILVSHGVPFRETRFTDYHSFQNETTALAQSIATGHGFSSPFMLQGYGHPQEGPSTWVTPVYPYFCAAIFMIFGVFSPTSYMAIAVIQALMSAVTIVFLLRIGEKTVGHRAAIAAAFLWALVPWFSKWPVTFVWDPTISCLLAMWLLWYALTLAEYGALKRWVTFGAGWGFALLANPAIATLFAVSLVWLLWRRWERVRRAAIAVLMCAVVVAPWIVRNRIVFGEWVFLRSNFPFEFSMANFPGSIGLDFVGRHPTANPAEFQEFQRLGELGYVRERAQTGKDFVRNHTSEFVRLTLKRIPMFWDGTQMKYIVPVAAIWLPWTYLPLSVVFLLALAYACDRKVRSWPLFLLVTLVYPLPYYITFSQVRYRLVLEPLMLLIVCWAAYDVIDRVRKRQPEA